MRFEITTDEMVTRLQSTGAYRVLRRVDLAECVLAAPGDTAATRIAVAVDVETTGFSPKDDRIIELAMRRFRYDESGAILKLDRPYSWLEDPHRPLEPDIVRLTGLSNDQLAGQQIDAHRATMLLRSADLVICHNAAFDRPFVDARLPGAAALAWACSCHEIDWSSYGFDGRALGWLLSQSGWFHTGHRAQADVDALITLLSHELNDGRRALSVLTEHAARPGWVIRAEGAHFDVKDKLKARGYRWDASQAVWCRQIEDEQLEREHVWLMEAVYSPGARPRAGGPHVERVTAETRYVRPVDGAPAGEQHLL